MLISWKHKNHLAYLCFLASLQACFPDSSRKEKAVPNPVQISPRLSDLFSKTKLLCFGRYALEVPQEAQLIWGSTSFPSKITTFSGGLDPNNERFSEEIEKLKENNKNVNITFNQKGPIENSWQIRYYPGKNAKSVGLYLFNTYVNKGDVTFVFGGAVKKNETEETAALREATRAKSLRLRTPDEVPTEPGYCIEHGFMTNAFYGEQEMVSVGIYLPSLPDITFSISSNKDAYSGYPKQEFEKMKLEELSLLARIHQAQEDQGLMYPHRTVLREGKRNVQHWHGEESLIKRKDDVHDFEWALVGTPGDVANPSEFSAQMYTKVKDNTVGAAKSASVSDDEAIALWDKFLSGLKFRVKVPGAPEGSYFMPPGKGDTTASVR
jgi:hypothetical protein